MCVDAMLEGLIGAINNFDFSLFYLINVQMNNYLLTLIMPLITEFGVMEYWILGCGLLYFIGRYFQRKRVQKIAILLLLAVLISYFGTEILKSIFARPRPFLVHGGVNSLTSVGPSIFNKIDYSFPSGHSAVIFAACTILSRKFGYWPLFTALACLVGFSRSYLGFHYPLDVIFGALFGILVSLLILRYEDQIFDGFDGLIKRIKSINLKT